MYVTKVNESSTIPTDLNPLTCYQCVNNDYLVCHIPTLKKQFRKKLRYIGELIVYKDETLLLFALFASRSQLITLLDKNAPGRYMNRFKRNFH